MNDPRRRTRRTTDARRTELVERCTPVFASEGFRGATSARLAAAGGVSDGLLFHHFGSKHGLYLACVDRAWDSIRADWDELLDGSTDPRAWLRDMGATFLVRDDDDQAGAALWLRAMTEAGDDERTRTHVAALLSAAHDYVTLVIERSQVAGGVRADANARAEAWIFVSTGLLVTVDRQLGGLATADLPAVLASRRAWLYGEPL